jgi:hypothetical protein
VPSEKAGAQPPPQQQQAVPQLEVPAPPPAAPCSPAPLALPDTPRGPPAAAAAAAAAPGPTPPAPRATMPGSPSSAATGHAHGLHRQLYRDAGRRVTLGHDNQLSWDDFISTRPILLPAWEGDGSGGGACSGGCIGGCSGGGSGACSPAAAAAAVGRGVGGVGGSAGFLSLEEGLALLASPAFGPLLSPSGSRSPSFTALSVGSDTTGSFSGPLPCCSAAAHTAGGMSRSRLASAVGLGLLPGGATAAERGVSFAEQGAAAAGVAGAPAAGVASSSAAGARSKSEAAELSAWLEDAIATAAAEPENGGGTEPLVLRAASPGTAAAGGGATGGRASPGQLPRAPVPASPPGKHGGGGGGGVAAAGGAAPQAAALAAAAQLRMRHGGPG